jgi:hypothetical protein
MNLIWAYHEQYGIRTMQDSKCNHYKMFTPEKYINNPLPERLEDNCNRGYASILPEAKIIRISTSPAIPNELRFIPTAVINYFKEHYPDFEIITETRHVFTFKSSLLKRAGMLSSIDLDHYDSELTFELLSLHDEIALNPIRGMTGPSYEDPRRARLEWNYTFNALKNILLPAVKEALPKLPPKVKSSISKYVSDGERKLSLAKQTLKPSEIERTRENYVAAGRTLESAFMSLHAAIDLIREATRRTPEVKSLKPKTPAGYDDFS